MPDTLLAIQEAIQDQPATDYNGTVRRWGHMIEAQWGSQRTADGGFDVQGCLTPLPSLGNTVLLKDGVYKFTNVRPMGTPRDGFFAHIIPDSSAR